MTEFVNIIKNNQFKVGEKYIVELEIVTNQERTFVMVGDPVAAGFKVINPQFRTSSQLDVREVNRDSRWRGYWGYLYRSEYYFDKVEVFADFLRRGTHKWQYMVIATNEGEYDVPNTMVSEMTIW